MLALRRPATLACGIFLAWYALVWATGAQFTTWYLDEGWQLAPRDVLADDPLGTVWYLHIQPPLWNLVLGVAMWVSPFADAITVQLVMLAFAVALVWVLAEITSTLVPWRWFAVAAPLYAVLNPDVFGNVLEPRYELAVSLLVAVLVLVCLRAPDPAVVPLVAGVVTVLVLTRALYHPVWMVAVLVLVAWRMRAAVTPRVLAVTGASSLGVAAIWMLKNLVLFGTFTLSSWTGMNALRSIEPVVDQAAVEELHAAGDVSGVALVGPFQDLASYEPFVAPCEPEHDHRSLTVEVRESRGALVANFNHECYLPLYDGAMSDAIALIRREPGAWWTGRVESAEAFTTGSSDLSDDDSPLLRAMATLYRVVDVQVPGDVTIRLVAPAAKLQAPTVHALVATTAVAVVALAPVWWRVGRRRRDEADGHDDRLLLALDVLALTVAWTFVVGVGGELVEQARFRSAIQPVTTCVAACLVARVLAPWTRGFASIGGFPRERGARKPSTPRKPSDRSVPSARWSWARCRT